MTDKDIINFIEYKMKTAEDKNFIRYSFFELKVERNLKKEEEDRFFEINKNYFENNGYNVFFTGTKYRYKNEIKTVESNELMIAIKNEE